MKARLMFRDRDFDLEQELVSNAEALIDDLDLNALFGAMALGDPLLQQVAKEAILGKCENDEEAILYRHSMIKDSLQNFHVLKSIYALTEELKDKKKALWLGVFSRQPNSILTESIRLLEVLLDLLGDLKAIAFEHGAKFKAEGFVNFFNMLKTELTDDFFAEAKGHLKELEFRQGVFISAELGSGNHGQNFSLLKSSERQKNAPWSGLLPLNSGSEYVIRVDPVDDAGNRSLAELRDLGINLVANTLAQSGEHVSNFFEHLRSELAFYLGCANLYGALQLNGVKTCFPRPQRVGGEVLEFTGLCDLTVSLSKGKTPVGNDLTANQKNLVVITGANQGGKSTFLRSVGCAQLMMQAGMFVAADHFSASLCSAVFTHYRRPEDKEMNSGKFDEELSRLDEIVDRLRPNSLILFNESFASTNEREGSEIASQVMTALTESGTRVVFVTHLYQYAIGVWEENLANTVFLRAERRTDGQRTFKLLPNGPLKTSYGADLL